MKTKLVVFTLLGLILGNFASAVPVPLQWDLQPPEAKIVEYRVYNASSRVFLGSAPGDSNKMTIELPPGVHTIICRAYYKLGPETGLETDDSNVLEIALPGVVTGFRLGAMAGETTIQVTVQPAQGSSKTTKQKR
jgi:hypothetical protein